ncbi:unnamed protein product [Knipowitschia caucasica]
MTSSSDRFEHVKAIILSCHEDTSAEEKMRFYDAWAKSYDQDLSVLDYRAPVISANALSSHFTGDRNTALVLDVACGTGLVAKELRSLGFSRFVGVDGSSAMLEMAKNAGLYEDVKQCILGSQPLPFQHGTFEAVIIVGALSDGQVPVKVVRELCMLTKPGGFTCLTTRANRDNLAYKNSLEEELRSLEQQALWRRVQTLNVDQWERAVSHHEHGYISGVVYLFQRL